MKGVNKYEVLLVLVLLTLPFFTVSVLADEEPVLSEKMSFTTIVNSSEYTGAAQQDAMITESRSGKTYGMLSEGSKTEGSSSPAGDLTSIEWQELLGGGSGDGFMDISRTSDNGYIAVGGWSSWNMEGNTGWKGSCDVWVVKMNSAGDVEWQKLLGGEDYDQGMSIEQNPDGSYILVGWTNSTGGDLSGLSHRGGADVWIAKLGPDGSIIWQNLIGGSGYDMPDCVLRTHDGGYIVSGYTESDFPESPVTNHGRNDIFVTKFNAGGAIEWSRLYGGESNEYRGSIVESPDGDGYVFVALTLSMYSGDVGVNPSCDGPVCNTAADVWVVKLDDYGNPVWNKVIGGNGCEAVAYDDSIQAVDDGYIIIAQKSEPYEDQDLFFVRLDENGETQWTKTYGGNDSEMAGSIQKTEGGYLFSASTRSANSGDVTGPNYGDCDMWAGMLDENGNLLWQDTFGGDKYEQNANLVPASDGGSVLTGRTWSGNSGNVVGTNDGYEDAWLVKIRPHLVVEVIDIYTNTRVPDAKVFLHDVAHNEDVNKTAANGVASFTMSGASDQYPLVKDGQYIVKVTADNYFDSTSTEVVFSSYDQKVTVRIKPLEMPKIEKTYSMTIIENYYSLRMCTEDDLLACKDKYTIDRTLGTENAERVKFWLKGAGWGDPVFEHYNDNVIKEDFGTQNGGYEGLDETTFHYYFGHGFCNVCDPKDKVTKGLPVTATSGLGLFNWTKEIDVGVPPYDRVHEHLDVAEVNGKWDKKNKWVMLHTCSAAGDPAWAKALKTSHGILGFKTTISTDVAPGMLPDQFFKYAIEEKHSIADAYKLATRDTFKGVQSEGGDIIGVTIFDNTEQYETDHLPDMGPIAPDEDTNDNLVQFIEWNLTAWDCTTPEKEVP